MLSLIRFESDYNNYEHKKIYYLKIDDRGFKLFQHWDHKYRINQKSKIYFFLNEENNQFNNIYEAWKDGQIFKHNLFPSW